MVENKIHSRVSTVKHSREKLMSLRPVMPYLPAAVAAFFLCAAPLSEAAEAAETSAAFLEPQPEAERLERQLKEP